LQRQFCALCNEPDLETVDERTRALLADRSTLGRRPAVELALDGEQSVDLCDGLDGDRRLRDSRKVEQLATRMGPTCVRVSPGKEEGYDLKPFIVIQRV
jgi:hypothetical protein